MRKGGVVSRGLVWGRRGVETYALACDYGFAVAAFY